MGCNRKRAIANSFSGDYSMFYKHYFPDLDTNRDSVTVRCFIHNDHTPSMSLKLRGEKAGCWYCHACNVGGDALEFYARRNNLTCKGHGFQKVLAGVVREFGIDVD